MNLSPIFIFGCVRSGTTLLRSIMNAHPSISCPRETAFFMLASKMKSIDDDASGFWVEYKKMRRFKYQGISAKKVEDILNSEKFSYQELLMAIMTAIANDEGKDRWCEKTPGHEKFADEILSGYNDSYILFMIRDPRAVSLSISKVPWGSKNVYVHSKIWLKSINKYMEVKDMPNVKKVQYETLVKKTSINVKEICEFLSVPFSQNMINDRIINEDAKKGEWTDKYEKKVERNITDDSVNKWQRELKLDYIRKIEILCSPYMKQFGYERITDELVWVRSILRVFYYLEHVLSVIFLKVKS